jgi:hypothetical protein
MHRYYDGRRESCVCSSKKTVSRVRKYVGTNVFIVITPKITCEFEFSGSGTHPFINP